MLQKTYPLCVYIYIHIYFIILFNICTCHHVFEEWMMTTTMITNLWMMDLRFLKHQRQAAGQWESYGTFLDGSWKINCLGGSEIGC